MTAPWVSGAFCPVWLQKLRMAAGMSAEVLSHEHTKKMAPIGAAKLETVLRGYLAAK